MSSPEDLPRSVQIGCLPLVMFTLFLLFLSLKLVGRVQWSWVWVLSPLWVAGGALVLLMALASAFIWVAVMVAALLEKD